MEQKENMKQMPMDNLTICLYIIEKWIIEIRFNFVE